MELASVLVSIDGDAGNQVTKVVTAAEIAVLRELHGNDAVTEIQPLGEVDPPRSHREERARLLQIYGKPDSNGRDSSPVSTLYPGAAARVFERLDELDIPDDLYKAERVRPARAERPVQEVEANTGQPDATLVDPELEDETGDIDDEHAEQPQSQSSDEQAERPKGKKNKKTEPDKLFD